MFHPRLRSWTVVRGRFWPSAAVGAGAATAFLLLVLASRPAAAADDADLIAFTNPGSGDPYTELLVDPSDGDQQLYEEVRPGVDALVTVTSVTVLPGSITDRIIVDRGDLDGVFTSNAFINTKLPNTSALGTKAKSVTLRIDFQDATTGAPVTLTRIAIAAKDLDGGSPASGEFVQFSGITRYCVYDADGDDVLEASDNDIAISQPVSSAYRFAGTGNQANSTAKEGWAEVFYDSASALEVTAGELLGNNARIAISFDDAGWSDDQVCVSVARPTYTLTYDANGATTGGVPASTTGDGALTVAGNAGSLAKGAQVFASWNSRADGTGQSFPVGSSYTPASDLTLYAQYTAAFVQYGPQPPPDLTCEPAVVPTGGDVSCQVTGGNAGIDILWEAARGESTVSDGVRLDAQGEGTFHFQAPAGEGDALQVRLVEWTGPVALRIVDAAGPVPTRIDAGRGASWMDTVLGAVGLVLSWLIVLLPRPRRRHRAFMDR